MRHIVICGLSAAVQNFSHFLINGTNFENVAGYNTWIFYFLCKLCLKHSHSKKNWASYDHKCLLVFMYSTWYSCQWTRIFALDFGKMHKYKISWKPVQWEPSCSMRTDRQTYRHDKANSRFSKLCASAYNVYVCSTCTRDVRYTQNETRIRLLAHRQE